MPKILLATLNAKYFHSSFGLRYLMANMEELASETTLLEFQRNQTVHEIVEQICRVQPTILGLGVYIWNVTQTLEVLKELRKTQPQLVIVLGGPEVSYETENQEISRWANHIIQGEGDFEFVQLCRTYFHGQAPLPKIIPAPPVPVESLRLPYDLYTDEDIAHRLIYVEASRGCPFRCEFCLSSLDIPLRAFPIESFLKAMEDLLSRGVRHFKFVDRTFNLNISDSRILLQFFLDHYQEGLFLHFEAIPDRFPIELRGLLQQFPPGSLQLEIGLQTFDEEVGKRIKRRQDYGKTEENLRFLREHTHAHIHADLIVGLPGESLESFEQGFDRLLRLNPHEIQVGILKRLRGTSIVRHTEEWGMVYRSEAPYDLLENRLIDAPTMKQMNAFATTWDRMANSGRFPHLLRLLWIGEISPFRAFFHWSHWLYQQIGRTHSIDLSELTDFFTEYLIHRVSISREQVHQARREDQRLRAQQAAERRRHKHVKRQRMHRLPIGSEALDQRF